MGKMVIACGGLAEARSSNSPLGWVELLHDRQGLHPCRGIGCCQAAPEGGAQSARFSSRSPSAMARGIISSDYCPRRDLVYLRLEAEGVGLLPVATRREVAREIESAPNADFIVVSGSSALVIQVKNARKDVERELKRLTARRNAWRFAGPRYFSGRHAGVSRLRGLPQLIWWLRCLRRAHPTQEILAGLSVPEPRASGTGAALCRRVSAPWPARPPSLGETKTIARGTV